MNFLKVFLLVLSFSFVVAPVSYAQTYAQKKEACGRLEKMISAAVSVRDTVEFERSVSDFDSVRGSAEEADAERRWRKPSLVVKHKIRGVRNDAGSIWRAGYIAVFFSTEPADYIEALSYDLCMKETYFGWYIKLIKGILDKKKADKLIRISDKRIANEARGLNKWDRYEEWKQALTRSEQ